MTTMTITVLNDETEEVEVQLPARHDVCPRCDGSGVHDHPAFSNGITSDEWERDWDEDSREDYLRGAYDVCCSRCGGKRVVLVPDEERFTPEQLAAWSRHVEVEREIAEEMVSERYLRLAEGGGFQ